MEERPEETAARLAEEMEQSAEEADHLAREHVRIARDMHERGLESYEALRQAEYMAERVTNAAANVRQAPAK